MAAQESTLRPRANTLKRFYVETSVGVVRGLSIQGEQDAHTTILLNMSEHDSSKA